MGELIVPDNEIFPMPLHIRQVIVMISSQFLNLVSPAVTPLGKLLPSAAPVFVLKLLKVGGRISLHELCHPLGLP